MAETIADLAAAILASPAPVLIPDTCAVLDVIRTGLFDRSDKRNLIAARAITAAALARPRALWIVAPQQVLDEWSRNRDTVVAEVERAVGKNHDHVEMLRELSGIVPGPTFAALDLRGLSLAGRLCDAAAALVDEAHVVDPDIETRLRALDRATQGVKPAQRGKDSTGDCLIFEHVLALGSELRARGFAHHILFVSSNTKDYGSPSDPGNELIAQFSGAGVRYVNDLAYAEALLVR